MLVFMGIFYMIVRIYFNIKKISCFMVSYKILLICLL